MSARSSLVEVMDCRQTADRPLSDTMMTQLTDTYIRNQASMS